MHSSTLRGTDFEMSVNGSAVSHADFFADFRTHQRLGVVAPQRVDGVGATALIMAYITAFYDRYRAEGGDFFAYPDFFTFQPSLPLAHYTMLDIWPNHKDVFAQSTQVDQLNAINDRGIDTLLVPDSTPKALAYQRPQLESARRRITSCYVYAFKGEVADADVVIRCDKQPLVAWATTVFETAALSGDAAVMKLKADWLAGVEVRPKLTQSFRRVTLDEALARL